MPIDTTYTEARAKLAELWDSVVDDREIAIIRRRGKEDVALLAASELASILETAHLLRSPRNAERLLTALARARAGHERPTSVEDLRQEIGLNE
jgi:antitoxin YefM